MSRIKKLEKKVEKLQRKQDALFQRLGVRVGVYKGKSYLLTNEEWSKIDNIVTGKGVKKDHIIL